MAIKKKFKKPVQKLDFSFIFIFLNLQISFPSHKKNREFVKGPTQRNGRISFKQARRK